LLEVCGRVERFVCSPSTAAAAIRASIHIDIRDLVPLITVPSLVYYTGDLGHTNVEQSRDLAARIPDARLIEVPGKLFYQPDRSPQLDQYADASTLIPRSMRPTCSSTLLDLPNSRNRWATRHGRRHSTMSTPSCGTKYISGSGDIGGLAVHIGARVMAKADARQVFVSEATADRTRDASFTFADRGLHQLKGVSGELRILDMVAG
jgi:hypothetical protein